MIGLDVTRRLDAYPVHRDAMIGNRMKRFIAPAVTADPGERLGEATILFGRTVVSIALLSLSTTT